MPKFVLPNPPGKFVTVDGLKIHYEEAGDSHAEPLLLIHGFMASSNVWKLVRDKLSERFFLVMPDLVGHGYSQRSDSFSMSLHDQAVVIHHFMDAVGIKSTHVLGHSMGGGIAILLASVFSKRVDKLILANALSYTYPVPLLGRLATMPGLGNFIMQHAYRRPALMSYLKNSIFLNTACIDPLHVDIMYAHLSSPISRRGFGRAMRIVLHPEELQGKPPRIAAPTLVLWSNQDRLFSVDYGKRLAGDIAKAEFASIDQSGHQSMSEKPEEFYQLVQRFLG